MNNLKAEMARRNLTAGDLAVLIKMNPRTLRHKIQGHSAFTIPEAKEISKALDGLTIDYLFAGGDQNAESSK